VASQVEDLFDPIIGAGCRKSNWKASSKPKKEVAPAALRKDQLMWIPEIAREITSRCTSEVPSKIV
jgi:hypothetical protein